MRQYKIHRVGKSKITWSAVKERNPKDAIKYVYRDFDIEITPGSIDKHTHKVELLYSKKESVTYYNVKVLGVKKKLLSKPVGLGMQRVPAINTKALETKTMLLAHGNNLYDIKIGQIIYDRELRKYRVLEVGVNEASEETMIIVTGKFNGDVFYIKKEV